MSLASALLQRTGLGALLGLQMNGLRNMYGSFGWKTAITHQDFVNKYKRQGVARRVVNAYPDAMWSDPPILEGDDAFNKAWEALNSQTPIFPALQKLDKLCRLGKFAILVVGFDDGRALDQPITTVLDAAQPNRKVIYLQAYSEGAVDVKTYEENTRSPRYGLPTSYSINPGNFIEPVGTVQKVAVSQRQFTVHWTRVLHVAENALESPIVGSSCLEPIYNDLDDLEKISGGSAEIFWLNARQGLHIDVDKEMELKPDDAKALQEEVDEYSNNLRRVIRTRGVKVSNLGSDYLDPRGVYDVTVSNIAACTGIPKRVLSGSEAGQLASQQDRANWSVRVEERVAEYGNPTVLIPFIRMLIDSRVLPVPKKLTITWPDAFKMNPLERAQTSAQMARSAANLAKTLFTTEQINHTNALDTVEQPIQTGFGGFNTNASEGPAKSSSGASKTPTGAPKDPVGSGDKKAPTAPEPQMQPALRPKAKIDYQLLTVEECRSIIGFGKHMPVFDSKQDAIVAIAPKGSE